MNPRHIAIIMDGNGRWAKAQGMPRFMGHRAGIAPARMCVEHCVKLEVKELSLFMFSTENWSRPQEEISAIFELLIKTLRTEVKKLHDQGIMVKFVGQREGLGDKLISIMEEAERLTEQNKTMQLNLALSYGGRWDILQAVKSFIAGDNPNLIEDKFNETISAQSFSDIDLLIRTGNENRISNFGLWQLAYAEIYFSKVLWPDFNEGELDKAIQLFESAKRRFGGVHE